MTPDIGTNPTDGFIIKILNFVDKLTMMINILVICIFNLN